jgi:hypothetical protein
MLWQRCNQNTSPIPLTALREILGQTTALKASNSEIDLPRHFTSRGTDLPMAGTNQCRL